MRTVRNINMRDLECELKEYLITNQSGNIKEIIKYTNCANLFQEELHEWDVQEYAEQLFANARQRFLNKIFTDEMLKIAQLFSERHIKVVFLKGIILAEKLYKEPEKRRSGDIDILVDIDFLGYAIGLLNELGYEFRTKNNYLSAQRYNRLNKEMQEMSVHIPTLVKRIADNDYKLPCIELDCHIAIYGKMKQKFEIAKKYLSRAELQEWCNSYVYVLEKYDNIIMLAGHYVKDVFRNQIFRYFSGWMPMRFNIKLNLLLDIAYLLERENVDYVILRKRLENIGKYKEFEIVFRIIAELFPNLIPNNFFEQKRVEKQELDVMPVVMKYLEHINIKEFICDVKLNSLKEILMSAHFRGEKININEEFFILPKCCLDIKNSNHIKKYAKCVILLEDNKIKLYIRIINLKTKKYLPTIRFSIENVNENKESFFYTFTVQVEQRDNDINTLLKKGKEIYEEGEVYINEEKELTYYIAIPIDENRIRQKRILLFDISISERKEDGEEVYTEREWMSKYNIEDYRQVTID